MSSRLPTDTAMVQSPCRSQHFGWRHSTTQSRDLQEQGRQYEPVDLWANPPESLSLSAWADMLLHHWHSSRLWRLEQRSPTKMLPTFQSHDHTSKQYSATGRHQIGENLGSRSRTVDDEDDFPARHHLRGEVLGQRCRVCHVPNAQQIWERELRRFLHDRVEGEDLIDGVRRWGHRQVIHDDVICSIRRAGINGRALQRSFLHLLELLHDRIALLKSISTSALAETRVARKQPHPRYPRRCCRSRAGEPASQHRTQRYCYIS